MDKIKQYTDVINRLKFLSESDEHIRCCFLFGSRAQKISHADEWSDLDVVVICKKPAQYIENKEWLKNFGKTIFAFKEAVSLGIGMQIRVLFDDFNDVDFAFYSISQFKAILKDTRFYHGLIGRGIEILVDKDDSLALLKGATFMRKYYTPEINQNNLQNNIEDFLYHAVSAIKKLHKGEVLTAKETLDFSMKNIIVLFIRWEAISRNSDIDTWHRNRHFEKWADEKFVKQFGNLYSIYNKHNIYEKVIVNILFFKKLTHKVCKLNDLNFSFDKFTLVLDWIKAHEPKNLLDRVFNILLKYNKGETSTNFEHHKKILENFIKQSIPIKMIIPAFPGKSINDCSVLSCEPDFGDILAIRTLECLCEELNLAYKFGCELVLFHDGHYFYKTGVMRPYNELDKYIELLKKGIKNKSIRHVTINHFFDGKIYDDKVNRFISKYCQAVSELKKDVLLNNDLMKKYLDESLFIKNEFSEKLFTNDSINIVNKKSKELALNFMVFEAGMVKLLEERFPDYFRLSIHVQNKADSKKFYIKLLPNCTNLGTPWFNITVKDPQGKLKLMKKKTAESLKYIYVENDGSPYYSNIEPF